MVLPDVIYGQDGACLHCGHVPMLDSMPVEARLVGLQIEHTARISMGMCPPAEEIARLMGKPLEQVTAALTVLRERGYLEPVPKGMKAEFPDQYRITKQGGWLGVVERLEHALALTTAKVMDQNEYQAVLRELREKIAKLEQQIAGYQGRGAELANAKRKIKELEDALQSTREQFEIAMSGQAARA